MRSHLIIIWVTSRMVTRMNRGISWGRSPPAALRSLEYPEAENCASYSPWLGGSRLGGPAKTPPDPIFAIFFSIENDERKKFAQASYLCI